MSPAQHSHTSTIGCLPDGHHYAPERPQREAAGQIHSRNGHARTHHPL